MGGHGAEGVTVVAQGVGTAGVVWKCIMGRVVDCGWADWQGHEHWRHSLMLIISSWHSWKVIFWYTINMMVVVAWTLFFNPIS
jgi:hypothetical protein